MSPLKPTTEEFWKERRRLTSVKRARDPYDAVKESVSEARLDKGADVGEEREKRHT